MITKEILEAKILELTSEEKILLAQANAVVGARNMCIDLLNMIEADRLNFNQKGDLVNEPDRLEDRVY